ncbi:glycosyltransferase family 4 protein [Halobaculum sp. MBLA0143]|uniref:glycosyltransferase family 4 protein n=1 Tax=Halobaculum sp. MBLA0143 TaxID=3079933 RepID=UPI0035237BC9
MDVALVNSVDATGGVGLYARQVAEHADTDISVTHYFLNKETRELVRRGPSDDREVVAEANLTRSIGGRVGTMASFFELARSIPETYDLYHVADQNLAPLCLLPRLTPTVVTVHDLVYRVRGASEVDSRVGRVLYAGLHTADRIVTVSQSTADDVVRFGYATDPSVVYNGVGSAFEPASDTEVTEFAAEHDLDADRYVLSIDADKPRKNVAATIRVFEEIRRRVPGDVRLLRTKPLEEAGTVAAELGVEGDIDVVGPVRWDRLPTVYSLGDVLISTSMYEGFGLPALEAMACGSPVVVSDVGSYPEVVGDAGFVEPVGQEDAFVTDGVELLTNPETRRRYERRGRKRADEFSWRQCGEATSRVYRQCVADG